MYPGTIDKERSKVKVEGIENHKYKEIENIQFVQSSLQSHPL